MTKTHSKTYSRRFTSNTKRQTQNGKIHKAFLEAYQFYIEKKESIE